MLKQLNDQKDWKPQGSCRMHQESSNIQILVNHFGANLLYQAG